MKFQNQGPSKYLLGADRQPDYVPQPMDYLNYMALQHMPPSRMIELIMMLVLVLKTLMWEKKVRGISLPLLTSLFVSISCRQSSRLL